MKESLYDTNLPVLEVVRADKGKCLGLGNEGEVHRYKGYAIKKIYKMSDNKIRKIEELGKLKDENFLFPLGFFGYESLYKEGYYMDEVHFNDELRIFDDLEMLYDVRRKLKIIKEADEALRRAHELGIILGDIKGDNILISEHDTPMFGDTDNYKYGDYDFDVGPKRKDWLKYAFLNENLLDNDKYVWAILVLRILYGKKMPDYCPSAVLLNKLVRDGNFSQETREILRVIFSDAEDKPYIGDIIDEKTLSLK